MDDRIPFGEAVTEKRLLKHRFDELTNAQQMVLLAAYGCELDNKRQDDRGWTQIDYWWASQGFATYDENGFIKRVNPPAGAIYVPTDFKEIWATAGIRGGKGECVSFATGYEAVCGGHDAYFREGQPAFILQIAQDLNLARESLHRIRALLDDIPFLTDPYVGPWSGKAGERIGRQTADMIRLWNGMSIKTAPPSVKAVRGYDAAAAVLDEVGVWPTADDAANVDEQVYTQVKSRFAQFPNSKLFAISSPWVMTGMLYRNHQIGTKGKNVRCRECLKRATPLQSCLFCKLARKAYNRFLSIHLTTAALGGIDGVAKRNAAPGEDYLSAAFEFLNEYRLLKPNEFRRECLAEFQTAIGAFLNAKLLDESVATGVYEREPIVLRNDKPIPPYLPLYVAAIDPAFRHDSFAFGVAHTDDTGKVVMDLMREWVPEPDQVLKPKSIITEIGQLLEQYDCITVACDQNQFESLEEIALEAGFGLYRVNFSAQSKNNIMGNLQQLLLQGRLVLLDHDDTLFQLKSLQKKLSDGGYVSIAAPKDQRDDLAVVVALLGNQAVSLTPAAPPEQAREKTIEEQCQEQIARKHQQGLYDSYHE